MNLTVSGVHFTCFRDNIQYFLVCSCASVFRVFVCASRVVAFADIAGGKAESSTVDMALKIHRKSRMQYDLQAPPELEDRNGIRR